MPDRRNALADHFGRCERLRSVAGRPDAMRSPSAERLRRRREIAAHQPLEREAADGGRDGVPARAHRHQVADADLVRRPGPQRVRGPGAEDGIPGKHGAGGVEHGRRRQVDRERPKPGERARRRQRSAAHAGPHAATVGRARDNARVTFTRIAWLVTVLACIVTGVALLVSGYQGYAAVFGAVGACAAINLR
jgi:hypothetical protein